MKILSLALIMFFAWAVLTACSAGCKCGIKNPDKQQVINNDK